MHLLTRRYANRRYERMSGALSNRRVAVLAADGFEKVELTIPVTVMKAAGATVEIVSLRRGRIRGVNLRARARESSAGPGASDGLRRAVRAGRLHQPRPAATVGGS